MKHQFLDLGAITVWFVSFCDGLSVERLPTEFSDASFAMQAADTFDFALELPLLLLFGAAPVGEEEDPGAQKFSIDIAVGGLSIVVHFSNVRERKQR